MPAFWDARLETPLANAGIVNGLVQDPLGVDGARVIVPNDLTRSILHLRLATATDAYKMPPLGEKRGRYRRREPPRAMDRRGHRACPRLRSPRPWKHADLGNVSLAGDALSTGDNAFSLKASGDDIWNGADAFHFVYRDLSGDGIIIARVLAMSDTDPWAKAGVMIRASLAAGAAHAFTALTPGNGATFEHRPATGAQTGAKQRRQLRRAHLGQRPPLGKLAHQLDLARWRHLDGARPRRRADGRESRGRPRLHLAR